MSSPPREQHSHAVPSLLLGLLSAGAAGYDCSPPGAAGYDCSLDGLETFMPGIYEGIRVNYLSTVTNTSSPQFLDRAAEFQKCTGARIIFAEAANVFDDPIKDVGGLGVYDGYLMSYSHFPEASRLGLAEPLIDRIRASNERLKWEDFFEMVKRQGQYRRDGQDAIDFLMFDGDFFVPLVRIDLLEKYNMPLPNTWDEVLQQARFFDGKDLNEDGEPDYGFCHFPRTGAGTWDWWWPELVYSTWATMAQTDSGQGFYFDTRTFEPLLDNAAFREAARIWKELWKMGEDGCPGHMATGRCAIGYSPPGCWKGVFLDKVARVADNGTVLWQPTMSDGSYAEPYRALPFGSLSVLNGSGELEPCTPESCPLAQKVKKNGHVEPDRAARLPASPHYKKLINRAPFYWSGGFGTMIRKSADEAVKDVIWDFFVYINSPETSVIDVSTYASWIDSWRRSQLSAEGENFVLNSTWSKDAYNEHSSAMWNSLESTSNGAFNLRIPGIKDYTHLEMAEKMSLFINDSLTMDELVAQVTARWKEINVERGLVDQLQIYRATLGLDNLDDFQLCQLHRGVMDAEDPRTCSQFDPQDSDVYRTVGIAVGITGGVFFGALLLGKLVKWMVKTVQTKRNLQVKEEMRQNQVIEDALSSMKDLRFPMVVLQVDWFMDMQRFMVHEEIRNTVGSKLRWLDTPEQISAFSGDNFLIFLSHQWLCYTEPDADGAQYRCARSAVKKCLEKKGWETSKVFVWLDISSVPQMNKAQQSAAISSLMVYASSADVFLAVVPDAVHKNTNQACNLWTYKNRAWCRAELLSHCLTNGIDNMYVVSADRLAKAKLNSEMMSDALFVFEGELSCCRMKHEGIPCCDRESLMVPFLGLFGLCHILKTKGRQNNNMHMIEFLHKIELEEVRVFPSECTVVTKDKLSGKDRTSTRPLFKGLLNKMKSKVETLTKEELESLGFVVSFDIDVPSITATEVSISTSNSTQMAVSRAKSMTSRQLNWDEDIKRKRLSTLLDEALGSQCESAGASGSGESSTESM